MKKKILSTVLVLAILLVQSLSLHHIYSAKHLDNSEQACELCDFYNHLSSADVPCYISFDFQFPKTNIETGVHHNVLVSYVSNSYNSQAPPIA